MLLCYQPVSRVVPLIYRRYDTDQVVVPAAMFPVCPRPAARPSGPRPCSVSGGIWRSINLTVFFPVAAQDAAPSVKLTTRQKKGASVVVFKIRAKLDRWFEVLLYFLL